MKAGRVMLLHDEGQPLRGPRRRRVVRFSRLGEVALGAVFAQQFVDAGLGTGLALPGRLFGG